MLAFSEARSPGSTRFVHPIREDARLERAWLQKFGVRPVCVTAADKRVDDPGKLVSLTNEK